MAVGLFVRWWCLWRRGGGGEGVDLGVDLFVGW